MDTVRPMPITSTRRINLFVLPLHEVGAARDSQKEVRMSKVRIILSALATAVVLSAMAVAAGQALADADHRCRQSGNQGREGTNTVNCFNTSNGGENDGDGDKTFADVDIDIDVVLTDIQLNVLNDSIHTVISGSKCSGVIAINVLSCNKAVEDVVLHLLNEWKVKVYTIVVSTGKCSTSTKC